MNRGNVSTLLSRIPERAERAPTGVPFVPQACSCAYPERLVQLSGPAPFTQLTDDTAAEGGSPNVYNVATHLGGLFLRTETHMTTTAGGLVVQEDNVSVFNTVSPAPPVGRS